MCDYLGLTFGAVYPFTNPLANQVQIKSKYYNDMVKIESCVTSYSTWLKQKKK